MANETYRRLKKLKEKSTWWSILLKEVKKGHMTRYMAEQRFREYAEAKDSCIKEGHTSPNAERIDHRVFWTKRFKHATDKKIPNPPNHLQHEHNRQNLGTKQANQECQPPAEKANDHRQI